MCFQALKNVRRPKTAKKNIYGFKLVKEYNDTSRAESPVRDFTWIIGKINSTSLDSPDLDGEVNKGFHCCKSPRLAKNLQNKWGDSHKRYSIAVVMIPKGTQYYENKTEYVSECMIMVLTDYNMAKEIVKKII